MNPGSVLLSVPLEVRYRIYDHVSARPEGSTLILKNYLEKMDSDIDTTSLPTNEISHEAFVAALPGNRGVVVASTPMDLDHDDEDDFDQNSEDVDMDGQEEEDAADNDSGEAGSWSGVDEEEEKKLDVHDDGMCAILSREEPLHGNFSRYRITQYRYTVPMVQVSLCAPPVNLLQACRQICDEASENYWALNTLYIDATSALEHLSMFENIITHLCGTQGHANQGTFPLDKVRKLVLRICWNAKFMKELDPINSSESPAVALLGGRLILVRDMITMCRNLRSLTINWHDCLLDGDVQASKAFQQVHIASLGVAHLPFVTIKDYWYRTEASGMDMFKPECFMAKLMCSLRKAHRYEIR